MRCADILRRTFQMQRNWKQSWTHWKRDRRKNWNSRGDYQRALLNDIKAEAETLAELLDADRLDRKKLKKAADNIWRMCYREL